MKWFHGTAGFGNALFEDTAEKPGSGPSYLYPFGTSNLVICTSDV
jgi:hypothetical protein